MEENCSYFLPFPKQGLPCTCLRYKSFENTVGKGEWAPFSTGFSFRLKTFLPFLLNLKLSSAKYFSRKCLRFVVWVRVKQSCLRTEVGGGGVNSKNCTVIRFENQTEKKNRYVTAL